MIVMALAIVAASCAGSAADSEPVAWHAALPGSLEESTFRAELTGHVSTALTADELLPAACVDEVARQVSDVLFADLGVVGLRNLGVVPGDAAAVGTNAFFESLPGPTRGRVVAAIAECAALVVQLSLEIPDVSYGSLACLVDRLSASGFFEMGSENGAAAAMFASAKTACLDTDEQAAYDEWSSAQLAAPPPVVLPPIDCDSIDTARFSAALGFDIDHFEPSLIKMDADRPVGCTFGNPDETGPWVLLYVATQDFQRRLYADYESPIPEFAQTWSTLTEVLDYAGVYFISQGGEVEWYEGAVTATFDDGNTTAALTAGDYVLMVSAGRGGDGPPLSRAHLAGAVEALAAALALS